MPTLENVLTDLGYNIQKGSNYYSTSALYRGGDNTTSITIYPERNLVIDWVSGERFTIESLIAKTLKIEEPKVTEWLKTKNVSLVIEKPEPKLEEQTVFPIEYIEGLVQDHSYWLNRGISLETLQLFRGGVATDLPGMNNRYVLGVWNAKNQLVGFQGRSLNNKQPKYKIKGEKSQFCYPFHLNIKEIQKKKEVILVEGVGCLFSLYEAVIRNVMVLFGVSLSNHQLTMLLRLNLNKIIISTNNDGHAGNTAAVKIQRRLLKFYDKKQIEVRLPPGKDFNEVLLNDGIDRIKSWYTN